MRDARQARDDLILYAVIRAGVYLPASKHHRQLSFDFGSVWLSA